MDEGEILFEYGEEGQHFYVIIEGEVSVKTPAPEELDEDQATPLGFLVYMIEYFHDIHWAHFANGTYMKKFMIEQLKELGIDLTNPDFNKH